jgi:WD40 repeat protein
MFPNHFAVAYSHVTESTMFPNHFAVTCSRDIHIYDSQFNKQLEWEGYSYVWRLLQLRDGRIASVSHDETIRIFNEDGSSIEWKGHTGSVYCLIQLQDGRIASASYDNTIRIWNLDGSSIEWKKWKGWLYCLFQLQDGRIAWGHNGTIRIWKRADASGDEDGSSIKWKGHICSVLCLIQLRDGRIASGSRDKIIRIWNLDGTSIKWEGHTDSVCCLLELQDGRIASGSWDKTIRIWKRADASGDEDGTSIEWKGHRNTVYCLLQLEDGRIVSGSSDDTIRIWNLNYNYTSYSFSIFNNLLTMFSDFGSVVCKGNWIIPIYTKEDMQVGRSRLYELLANYVIEDVKSIVYQYVKPL